MALQLIAIVVDVEEPIAARELRLSLVQGGAAIITDAMVEIIDLAGATQKDIVEGVRECRDQFTATYGDRE